MNLITMSNFTFNYPDQPPLIQGVSFAIEAGSFNLLMGLNGSGKTTLIQHLTPTFLSHGQHTGKISFRDEPLASIPPEKVGYVMQHPDHQIVTDKVWHELAFGLENLGKSSAEIRQRIAEIVNFFGMQQWFEQDIATLSGGQKQLLNLASVVVMDPELLILDEPTAQLDPIATDNFIQMLHKLNHELGITILITEHEVAKLLPYTNKILVLEDGKLLIDAPVAEAVQQIFEQVPYLSRVLPAAAQIVARSKRSFTTLPLTVNAGKAWLQELNISKVAAQSVNFSVNPTKPLIVAKHLWFTYENQNDIIRDLNLTINEGEIFMLLGANGSGKSTFMKLLLGQLFAYRGKLTITGTALKNKTQLQKYRSQIGYLPQDPTTLFVKDTVLEDLQYGLKATVSTERDLLSGIDSFGLASLINQNPLDLSGGQQQLVGLLKVILRKPKILFLDEPTKGLDTRSKNLVANVLNSLKKEQITIIMITHDIDFTAQNADRVGLFFNGGITSCAERHAFFSRNNFYTTEASRISRAYFPNAITVDEVLSWLKN